jgi:hypothetical protein
LKYFKEKKIWEKLFLDEFGEMPSELYDKCCAQFLVSRNRIRLRSKKFYINLLNYILYEDKYEPDEKICFMGYILEYLWHYIFGEPAIMKYDMNNTILDYYYYEDIFSLNKS